MILARFSNEAPGLGDDPEPRTYIRTINRCNGMTITIGLIGAGGIARTQATHLHRHDDATIVGVCDIDRHRTETLAKQVEAAALSSVKELFERRDIDAVYICTPSTVRTEPFREAARAGVDIFCEATGGVT